MRLALTAVLLLAALPSGAQAAEVGVSEQHPQFLSSPLFQQTEIQRVRRIAPWDSARLHWQRAEVDRWMFAARAARKEVLVSFSASRSSDKRLPSPGRYKRAVSLFIKRYPWIRAYSAWNEPNLGATKRRPRLVARYYRALRSACPGCRVIGAEVVDSPNMASWLGRFQKAVKRKPRLWGLHNYNDANRFSSWRTRRMLKQTRGEVWLTETGGIVRKKHLRRQKFPGGEAHQAKATRFLLDKLAPLSERIQRVYLYHWNQEGEQQAWDSGLVRADGSPRPAYFSLKRRVEDGKLLEQAEAEAKE